MLEEETESGFVHDGDLAATGTDDTLILEASRYPNDGLRSNTGHISNLLSGKGQGGPNLGGEHQQGIGNSLIDTLTSHVSQAVMSIPDAFAQQIDDLQRYLWIFPQEAQEVISPESKSGGFVQ